MKTRLIGLASLVLSTACWTSVSGDGPVAATGPSAGKALAPDFEKAYQALTESVRAMDRTRFDSRAVVEKTGRDPQKLLAWVSDNTALVPYRGALRGALFLEAGGGGGFGGGGGRRRS